MQILKKKLAYIINIDYLCIAKTLSSKFQALPPIGA